MFGQQPIEDDKLEGVIVSSSGKRGKQMNIESVRAEHAGEYTCIASNNAGSTTRTAILDVNGIFFFFNVSNVDADVLFLFSRNYILHLQMKPIIIQYFALVFPISFFIDGKSYIHHSSAGKILSEADGEKKKYRIPNYTMYKKNPIF